MIHIWLPNAQAELRVWQSTTQSWQTAANWQEVATLISFAGKASTNVACLYFPSVHLLQLQPALSAAQLKALGESGRQYLFEETSISAVDDLHIKMLSAPNQPTQLLALHASDRDTWLQAAQLAGIAITALLPDYLLLPNVARGTSTEPLHTAVFYQDPATQLLSFGDGMQQQGMAISYLPLVLTKFPQIDHVYVMGDINPALTHSLAQLPNISHQMDARLPTPVADPMRHWLNFALIRRDSRTPPYVKAIAAVLLCAIVTAFVVDGLRWYYYQQAERQASALLKQQYEQWFPNERFNPRLSIERQLSGKLVNEQTASANVLTTLSAIQPVLRQYQIEARQVNYQGDQLQLQVLTRNTDQLNQAMATLKAQGLAAKLGNVSPIDSGAMAMLEIGL